MSETMREPEGTAALVASIGRRLAMIHGRLVMDLVDLQRLNERAEALLTKLEADPPC